MSIEDHERRINRIESTLFGSDDNPDRGMTTRFMMTESAVLKLEAMGTWIIRLLVLGIITALMNLVITSQKSGSAPNSQSTNVITSDAAAKAAAIQPETRRDYLLVSEVAAKEGVTDRTILNWIEDNAIQPKPTQTSKGWQIDKAYVIPSKVRKTSDEYGNSPKISANHGTAKPP